MRIAPNPSRCTGRSPPILKVPLAFASAGKSCAHNLQVTGGGHCQRRARLRACQSDVALKPHHHHHDSDHDQRRAERFLRLSRSLRNTTARGWRWPRSACPPARPWRPRRAAARENSRATKARSSDPTRPGSTQSAARCCQSSPRLVVKNAMPQVKTRMTVVRMAVARLELMSATPTLARIAVSAAKRAESSAQPSQFMRPFLNNLLALYQPSPKWVVGQFEFSFPPRGIP